MSAVVLVAITLSIGVVIGYNIKTEQMKNRYPMIVNGYTPEKTPIETRGFSPGDTVSSTENGALILWNDSMGIEMIVGIITESGRINTRWENE